jgi:hypothetical protein
MLKRVK